MLNKNDYIFECKSSYVTVSDCDCGSTALPCNVSSTVRDIVPVSLTDTEIQSSEGMIHEWSSMSTTTDHAHSTTLTLYLD